MVVNMDRLQTMRAFVSVVKQGSFAKAAEYLSLSPQLVSKYVSHLEDNLQSRLLNRTTRKLSLTEAGRFYFERCTQLLIDLEEMDNALAHEQGQPSGKLRITAPMSFGMHHLPKLVVDYQQRYPQVDIDLQLSDKKIDIVEDGYDIALRIGKLQSSSLIAKKITDIRIVVCAAPKYLQQYSIPKNSQQLMDHRYLSYSYADSASLFAKFEQVLGYNKLNSTLISNNGDLLVNAAIHGGGIAIQPSFIAGKAISQGELQEILPDYAPDPLGLYVVYAHRKFLSSKVRSFVDFISEYYGECPYWDDY